MKELLKALLERIKTLKKAEKTGFTDEKAAAEYLVERESALEEVAKALSDLNDAYDTELQAIKSQLGTALEGLKKAPETKELSKEERLAEIGKLVRAAWRKNLAAVAEAGAVLNSKERTDDWDNERSIVFDKTAGRFKPIERAALGSPVGSSGDGTYIINTIMERELIRYATEWSDMMPLVRNIPMAAKSISWPTLNRHVANLFWLTDYGTPAIQQAGKPSFGARVQLDAATVAGYIPWYDEFEDDIQINVTLGQLFMEMFSEAYASEFDLQVLMANSAPFKGIFQMTGAGECLKKYVGSQAATSVSMDDLKAMPLMIPRADRQEGIYLVSEEMVSYLISLRSAVGDFLIQPPNSNERPGRLCGYPYREIKRGPGFTEVEPGKPFAWFGVPNRTMWHGDRKGIEIRTFSETTESLLHGEQFIRFRKRDAFKIVQPDLSVLLMTRA